MKKYLVCFALSLAAVIGINSSALAGNPFDIQRIRIIPNPAPGLITGEEVLELTFILHAEGWVPGVGWSLRYYDKGKEWLSTTRTAYFPATQNNLYLLREDYFKGGVVFVALFPLRQPEAAYMVISIGDGFNRNVQLFPYTALLQNFNIPVREIDREILSSDYVVFEEEIESL
jgi:hypothetical protein